MLESLGIRRLPYKKRGRRAGVNTCSYTMPRKINVIANSRYFDKSRVNSLRTCFLTSINPSLPQFSFPRILLANVRSARNKFDEIQSIIFCDNIDVAVFTESWLEESDVEAFEILGFKAFHRIRSRPDKSKGGGVSFFLSEKFTLLSVNLPTSLNVEAVSITCRSNYLPRNVPFFSFIAFYAPPNDLFKLDINDFICTEIDRILTVNLNANIFVLGDFNDLDVSNIYALRSFKQIVNVNTRGDNVLDKCYFKGSVNYRTLKKAPVGSSDHCALCFVCDNLSIVKQQSYTYFCRPRKNSSFCLLGKSLLNFDWSYIFGINDLDILVELFSTTLRFLYESAFPLEKKIFNSGNKNWITTSICDLIHHRNHLFNTGAPNNDIQTISRKIKIKIKEAKKKEYNYLINNIKVGSSNYYKIIKRCTGQFKATKHICFPNMSVDETAIAIGEYFESLANSMTKLNSISLPAYMPGLALEPVSVIWTYNELAALPAKNNTSPDGIPAFILKYYALELCEPITELLNRSIGEGRCPLSWKNEILLPIPKSASVSDPHHVRPLSLSSSISKLCEKYIYSLLLPQVIGSIDAFQFGGVPNKSTAHYLTLLIDNVLKPLENTSNRSATIITDFNKAFNLVDHQTLILSLIEMCPSPYLVKWISSFLENRSQSILLPDSKKYQSYTCNNGIPQGSVLSSLLFAILSSSIVNSIDTHFKFVDDLSVVCSGNHNDIENIIRNNIDIITKDTALKNMSFNSAKSCFLYHDFSRSRKIINISLNNIVISEKPFCKILGVFLQCDLKWNKQVEEMLLKASKRTFIICKMKKFTPNLDILVNLYKTFIRPILEFNCMVWGGAITKHHSDLIENFQKRILKIILGKSYTNYLNALVHLSLESLSKRRLTLSTQFAVKFFKLYPNLCPPKNSDLSNIQTRNASKYYRQYIRTSRYATSPVPHLCKLLNSVAT